MSKGNLWEKARNTAEWRNTRDFGARRSFAVKNRPTSFSGKRKPRGITLPVLGQIWCMRREGFTTCFLANYALMHLRCSISFAWPTVTLGEIVTCTLIISRRSPSGRESVMLQYWQIISWCRSLDEMSQFSNFVKLFYLLVHYNLESFSSQPITHTPPLGPFRVSLCTCRTFLSSRTTLFTRSLNSTTDPMHSLSCHCIRVCCGKYEVQPIHDDGRDSVEPPHKHVSVC